MEVSGYCAQRRTGATQQETSSVLEQLVLYRSQNVTGGYDVHATLRVQHTRPTNLGVGEVTLFDLLEQARAVLRVLASARGATPEDLNPPERTVGGTIDLVELETRVIRGENGLNAAHAAKRAVRCTPERGRRRLGGVVQGGEASEGARRARR